MLKPVCTAILVLAALLLGCGGTIGTGGDAGGDATPDLPPADVETEVDPDAVPDVEPDTEPDPVPDAVPDTEPDPADDTVADTETDGSGCASVQIPFEAEDMTLDSGFGTRTSSREYIGLFIETLTRNNGTASIELAIPCTDTYVLWGVVWFESGNEDSFRWAWDDTTTTWVWDLAQQGCSPSLARDWYWDEVSQRTDTGTCGDPEVDPATFVLTEGTHTFYLLGREPNAAVAEFVLTNDRSYTPPAPPSPH